MLIMSGKNTTLLRIKEWLNEIATSHRTLLAMTEQEKTQIPLIPFVKGEDWFLSIYFHCRLVLLCSVKFYSENTGMIFIGNFY